jgi:hypothetical protein
MIWQKASPSMVSLESQTKLASDPDKTTTIFRRYDRLSSRSLLFLEAELAELEALQINQMKTIRFRRIARP